MYAFAPCPRQTVSRSLTAEKKPVPGFSHWGVGSQSALFGSSLILCMSKSLNSSKVIVICYCPPSLVTLLFHFSPVANQLLLASWGFYEAVCCLCSRFRCARIARRVPHIGYTTVNRSLRLSLHSLPSCVNWLPTYAQLRVDLSSHWLHCRLPWDD